MLLWFMSVYAKNSNVITNFEIILYKKNHFSSIPFNRNIFYATSSLTPSSCDGHTCDLHHHVIWVFSNFVIFFLDALDVDVRNTVELGTNAIGKLFTTGC